MAVYSGRWHESGNPIDQLQRAERQLGGTVGLRLGEMVAQMLVIDSLETLEGKGRASTIIIRAMRDAEPWTLRITMMIPSPRPSPTGRGRVGAPAARVGTRWQQPLQTGTIPTGNSHRGIQ